MLIQKGFEYLFFSVAFVIWAINFMYVGLGCLALSKEFELDGIVEGWFGFRYDNTDYQWRKFRENLPIIVCFNLAFVAFGSYVKSFKRIRLLQLYYSAVGLVFVFVLHGQKLIYLLLIITIYRKVTMQLIDRKFNSLAVYTFIWVVPCSLKLTIDKFEGFSSFSSLLDFELFPWQLCFNFALLRMISFATEYKGFSQLSNTDDIEIIKQQNLFTSELDNVASNRIKHCLECHNSDFCQSYLIKIELDQADHFNYINYICYFFYPPIYFSGPIITFNSFIFQANISLQNHRKRDLWGIISKCKIYVMRVLILLVSFEFFNHFLFVQALINNNENATNEGLQKKLLENVSQTFFISFYFLCFIWFKFSIIWKVARLFSMLDGITTEENMNRCIYNNYCFEDFWRAWHKSFNQWLIKYIYIPIGGKNHKLMSIWIVFSFVALWHEVKWELLLWAWFICICLIPEVAFKKFINKKLEKHKLVLEVLQHSAASTYIFLLIIANLIGFGTGHDKFNVILLNLWNNIDLKTILLGYAHFIPSVYIMFWKRNKEEENLQANIKQLKAILKS